MGVYFSWKPKCQQPAVLTRMLCATSASVLPTSIIFMYYFPSWHITTISSMPAECFSNPNHAVTNFWRQVNDQVWKKHCLFLSSDKTARIKITLKQEHPWAYYRSEKEKSKYFLLLQHLTSWCITALYNPVIFPMHLQGLQILCSPYWGMEKLRNAERVFLPIEITSLNNHGWICCLESWNEKDKKCSPEL